MAKEIKLGIRISGNSSDGVKAIRLTKDELVQLKNHAARSGKAISGIGKKFDDLKRVGSTALKSIGLAFGALELKRFVSGTLDASDKIQKLSIRLGASTEALSQYKFVAEQTGVTFDALTTAWQRQTRRISEAAKGTGEAKGALLELGLSAERLNNLAPEKQFEIIADRIDQVSNKADKVRLAMNLWDSEGVTLLQTIEGGSKAIKDMRDEADRLGLTLTRDQANAIAKANDQINILTKTISAGLSKAIIENAGFFADMAKTLGSVIPRAIGSAVKAFDILSVGVSYVLESFFRFGAGISDLLSNLPFVDDTFKSLNATFSDEADRLVIVRDELKNSIIAHDKMANAAEATSKSISNQNKTVDSANIAIKKYSESLGQASGDAEHFKGSVQRLIDKLFPAQRAARDLASEQQLLEKAVDKGLITWNQYDAALVRLTQTNKTETGALQTQKKAVGGLSDEYKNLGSSIGQAASAANSAASAQNIRSNKPPAGNTRAAGGLLQFSKLFGGVNAFASGGRFTVGGTGGVDSQLVAFRASPKERVTIETPAQQRDQGATNNVTINMYGIQNVQEFVAELESFSRTNPIKISIGDIMTVGG